MKWYVAAVLVAAGPLFATDLKSGLSSYEAGRYDEAFAQLMPSAKQGEVQAQYRVGWMFEHGQGTSRDYEEAARWYAKAAGQGDAEAQCALGGLYEFGMGVERNLDQAAGFYREAATQQHPEAIKNIQSLEKRGLVKAVKPPPPATPPPTPKASAPALSSTTAAPTPQAKPIQPAKATPTEAVVMQDKATPLSDAPPSAAGLSRNSPLVPQAKGTRRIVLNALDQTLGDLPTTKLVVQGSWIRPNPPPGSPAKAYLDPLLAGTSDHDIRMIWEFHQNPAESTAEALARESRMAASEWRMFRERLIANINGQLANKSPAELEQFLKSVGFEAEQVTALLKNQKSIGPTILKSINLYPPDFLISHAKDLKDASRIFKDLGGLPNLGNDLLEGSWGESHLAAIQEFEKTGLFMRRDRGRTRLLFSDLAHIQESYGRYTLGGSAELADQELLKIIASLQKGNHPDALKHLRRAKIMLNKSRDMARLGKGTVSQSMSVLDDLIANPRADAATLASLERIRDECRWLAALQTEGSAANRAIIIACLQASGRFERLTKSLGELVEAARNFPMAKQLLHGTFLALSIYCVHGKAVDQGMDGALREAGVQAVFLTSLPIGAAMAVANSVIDGAKDYGYALALQPQDCEDLMEGIIAVRGAEALLPTAKSATAMATEFTRPSEVASYITNQAVAAALEARAKNREKMVAGLTVKCTNTAIALWQFERSKIINRFLDERSHLETNLFNHLIRLEANPDEIPLPANGSAEVTVRFDNEANWDSIAKQLESMGTTITSLGGPEKHILFGYGLQVDWVVDGKAEKTRARTRVFSTAFEPRHFTFSTAGLHEIKAICRVTFETDNRNAYDKDVPAKDVSDLIEALSGEYVWEIPVEVVVTETEEARPAPPKEERHTNYLSMPDAFVTEWEGIALGGGINSYCCNNLGGGENINDLTKRIFRVPLKIGSAAGISCIKKSHSYLEKGEPDSPQLSKTVKTDSTDPMSARGSVTLVKDRDKYEISYFVTATTLFKDDDEMDAYSRLPEDELNAFFKERDKALPIAAQSALNATLEIIEGTTIQSKPLK